MDNYEIADQLSLLSKLMDIHGENSFKAKSYASAAFAIEKLPTQLNTLSTDKIENIKSIGDSVAKKIIELITTNELSVLKELIAKTPVGVLDMLQVKGLGPKKIYTIWKEMNIDTIDDLKEACLNNRLAEKKGFGEKTQQKILEAINFQQQNSGSFLYAQVEPFSHALTAKLNKKFGRNKLEMTGAFIRQLEIIDSLDWITTIAENDLESFFNGQDVTLLDKKEDLISFITSDNLILKFYTTTANDFYVTQLRLSSSEEFFNELHSLKNWNANNKYSSEKEIFEAIGLPFIPPFLREHKNILAKIKNSSIPEVLQVSDVKGLIHA
ncbi:MAG TPA: helix-hairpin-helix domain-containing protein, partial [Chitinophagaceae bacterium]|nr:helix-hairpin-helix domain-containing protein [Chitinophagaceae bacterium]